MAEKFQSTKSGRQIDFAVDYVEKLPNAIDKINENIKNLNNDKADANIIPRRTGDLTDNTTEQTYNPESNKPQSGKAVAEAIAKLLGSAPENLDTLEELAKALNEDENFSASVLAEIAKKADATALVNKVSKEKGKGLSSNDFTDDLKTRLENNTFDYYIATKNYGEEFDYDSYTNPGIYLLYDDKCSDDEIRPYYILTVSYWYDMETGYVVTQSRMSLINNILYVRYNDNGWTNWKKISATQEDLDDAIGDIEASLENIIKKYGLGGDSV